MKPVALLGALVALFLPAAAVATPWNEDEPDDWVYNYDVDLGATITKVESYLVTDGEWDYEYTPIASPAEFPLGGDVTLSFWFDIYEFGFFGLNQYAQGPVNEFDLKIGTLSVGSSLQELIIGENLMQGGYGFSLPWYPYTFVTLEDQLYQVYFWSTVDGLIDIDGLAPDGVWAPSNLRGMAEFYSVGSGPSLYHAVYFGQVPKSETSVVPEPATWALLIAGFGIVGVAARRRRRSAEAA